MSTKENSKFVSFGAALFAAQMLLFHYATLGFHVTLSASKKISYVSIAVFHDEDQSIVVPVGYTYSEREELDDTGTYWTSFRFSY